MEYMTVPKLAREMKLSDNTVRRYIKNYPQFFRAEKIDGWDQYPADTALRILNRINEISRAGQRRSEVLPVLMNEFDVVEDNETAAAEKKDPAAGAAGEVEFGPKTLAAIAGVESAIRELIEVMKSR